jgi:hypothetical protein
MNADNFSATPCSNKECGGIIDMNKKIPLMTGCSSYGLFFPCTKCGRIHTFDGSPMSNRAGNEVFFIDGKIIHREPIDE